MLGVAEGATALILSSKDVFRNFSFNFSGTITNRIIFGATVANCPRDLASPSCTKRLVILACPLIKGCKIPPFSVRRGNLPAFVRDRGVRTRTVVIDSCDRRCDR